jgi:hypothetical protein
VSMSTELPAGIEPWGEALAALTPALAGGLLPMIRALDDLIHRRDAGSGSAGPFDGYDGLATRGTPERILISEWMLAEEAPLEFMRRASQNELLHLAPSFRRPQPRGRVVVLLDNGPEQLGTPRLAQLAALIVLHRRAASRGAGIVIAALGDEADAWIDGDIGRQLRTWRIRRSHAQPDLVTVERRHEQLEDDDEVWIISGPSLAACMVGHPRVMCIAEGAWAASGVTELHVDIDGDVVELALPSRELSVRALRGSAFRFREALSTADNVGSIRNPVFNSAARQLLMRGDGDRELLSVTVSDGQPGTRGRIRRHQFPGPVLAAAYLGRRLVALTLESEQIKARVVGKPLGRVDRLSVSAEQLGTNDSDIRADAWGGLPPLYFTTGGLIAQFLGTWWKLGERSCEQLRARAVGPGQSVDTPRIAMVSARGVWLDGAFLPGADDVGRVLLGHGGWCGISDDGVYWRICRGSESAPTIAVGDGAEVLALVVEGDEPKLVTISVGGLVVRLVGHASVRTLTSWSGGPGRPSVHPTLPLIAVDRGQEVIEIGNLLSGDVLQVVRGDA